MHGSVQGVSQFLKRDHLVVLNSRPGYTLCPAGCASQRNFCDGISCQNGGTCVNRWNTYLCDCPLRFGGKNCEQGKNLSLSPDHSGVSGRGTQAIRSCGQLG